jgi:ketosteroid isomerase-like protein
MSYLPTFKNMRLVLLISAFMLFGTSIFAQNQNQKAEKNIYTLIDNYSKARENKDASLLKKILMADIDQLVSSGEWRVGIDVALEGMMKSSKRRPGSRTIKIDKIKFLNATSAIADARYEIQNEDGTSRKMWSSFIVVEDKGEWKISAIRNMLPAK